MNRKDLNNIIKMLVPVSSVAIGAPRHKATMKEYADKNLEPCDMLYITLPVLCKENIKAPAFFGHAVVRSQKKLFVANLNRGRVWGNNGAVIAHHDYFICDVSREFNKGMNIEHSVFYTIKQVKPKMLQGTTSVIGTAGANVYYHWMLDVLPRLALVKFFKPLHEIDYFVTAFGDLPFQLETLAKLEIPIEKIIQSNNNWNFHVKSEVLLTPSLAGELDQPNEHQVNFLRSLYHDYISTGMPFRKLYISRVKTGRRLIVKEKELLYHLLKLGFEIINCEELTVIEQVSLFSEAKIIISSHGSALTNLVFCQKNAIIIDIFNESHVNACFWFIAQINSLKYHYFSGKSQPIDNNQKNDNTIIDMIAFNSMLQQIGII